MARLEGAAGALLELVIAVMIPGCTLSFQASSAGRGKNPPAPPHCPNLIVLLLFAAFAKGKKDKKQKSRGNPDAAEAYIVVAVGRIGVAPIGNGAEVGIVAPATTAKHTARPAGSTMGICL